LSLAYHWTPVEIAELTLPQLALYLAETIEPEGRVAMPVEAGVAYVEQRRAERTAWVNEVLQTSSVMAPQGYEMSRAGEVLPTSTNRVIERTNVLRESHVLRERETPVRRLLRTHEVRRIEQRTRTDERRVVNVIESREMGSAEPARVASSAPSGSQVLLEEMRHRLTLLDATASEIEVAVESLRRKQSAAARFS